MSSIPVHSAIVLPLIVYNNDHQVYVAACSAIYHIMSSADCNGECMLWVCAGCVQPCPYTTGAVLEELAERGVGSTLEGLREHHDKHICLEWGCRALRTLIMDRYVMHCVILYVTMYVILYVMLYVTLCVIMCHALCHSVCNILCHIICVTITTVLIRRNTWRCVWRCLI